ncbi:RNA polymerase II complex component [Cavenderia fasciculata]|uniref:RNA polymerase II complex component n=1 Tax=Cavenderia fasciculata TaxID=261658 RepID=F4PVI6_CACFS|nr:RNA polymerase II complex component [Cavenderia fasciculata]EGG20000.1 RNA polymerase II complex component [Cavenderia fasciculata]|eukprot:XP_004366983.1 RNA polymerase II complex component [Cavenderia fasciculata]
MGDPLTLLRDYISTSQQIVQEGDDYVFGKTKFNKNTPTAFKSSTGGNYTLQAVHFFYVNRDVSRGVYVLQTTRVGTNAVAVNDRKKLLAYLEGSSLDIGEDMFQAPPITQSIPSYTSDAMDIEDVDMNKRIGGEIQEIELTLDLQTEKDSLALRIDTVKSILPEGYNENESDFIESIKNKRKLGNLEKNGFVLADENVTKNIVQREKLGSDRSSILSITTNIGDSILESYKKFKKEEEEEKKRKSHGKSDHHHHGKPSSSSQSSSQQSSSSSLTSSSSSSSSTNIKNRTPIIIVPSSMTSPISIYNVKDLLQSSKYISSLEKKEEMSAQNISKPSMSSFDRLVGTQKVAYEVFDNTRLLKPEDWMRVAAVFVQGEAWQFKDWKWSNPVDLLSNVKGYYLKYDDHATPDVVKSWDVKILNISKQKRHLDQTAQIEFWNSFDEYILTKKPYLNH